MKLLKTKCFNCKGDLYEGKFIINGFSNKKWCSKECLVESRLNEIRKTIQAESISYGEIAELQSLAKYINKSDVELLQWAGINE